MPKSFFESTLISSAAVKTYLVLVLSLRLAGVRKREDPGTLWL